MDLFCLGEEDWSEAATRHPDTCASPSESHRGAQNPSVDRGGLARTDQTDGQRWQGSNGYGRASEAGSVFDRGESEGRGVCDSHVASRTGGVWGIGEEEALEPGLSDEYAWWGEWSEGPEGDMAGAGRGQIRCQGGEREINGECLQHNELKRAKGRLDEQLDVSYDHFRIESTFLWISLPRTTHIHDTSLCNDLI